MAVVPFLLSPKDDFLNQSAALGGTKWAFLSRVSCPSVHVSDGCASALTTRGSPCSLVHTDMRRAQLKACVRVSRGLGSADRTDLLKCLWVAILLSQIHTELNNMFIMYLFTLAFLLSNWIFHFGKSKRFTFIYTAVIHHHLALLTRNAICRNAIWELDDTVRKVQCSESAALVLKL